MSFKKKIFLGVGALLIVVIGYIAYIMMTTRSHSPAAVEAFEVDGISLEINYCRPYKKDRLIFGSLEEGALLPYGKYWRLGANAASKLTLNTDIEFGGKKLSKGNYSLYAFPEADYWVIGINSEADRWGASPPDFSQDIARIKVPVVKVPNIQEQFTISMEEKGGNAEMIMQWDQVQVRIPVKSANQ